MARREDYDIVLRATDATAAAFASAQRNLASLNGAVGTLRGGLGALAGLFVGQQIVQFGQDAVSSLAAIGSQAKTVGVTTDALQALRFEVEQSGGAALDADAALQRFAEAASKAGTGSNYLAKVLQANGIALRDQNGNLRSATDLLEAYARLVANATSQQDKVRLASEAFTKQTGPQMVETLERIASVGMRALIAKTRELGGVADESLIRKADEIDKKWKQIASTFVTYVKGAFVQAIEAAEDFSEKAGTAAALEKGTASFKQLAYAISLARKRGSPIDPTWIAEFERLAELQRELNRGKFPTITVQKPTVLPLDNDAIQKEIDSIARHAAVLRADAASVDATAGAHERMRVQFQLLEVALQHGQVSARQYNDAVDAITRGRDLTGLGELGAKINRIGKEAQGAADALAAAQLRSDIFFQRAQLGRTQIEQAAAQQLRSAKIDPTSAQGEFFAQQIRINEALRQTKELGSDALKGIISDLRAGKSGAEVLANALDKVASKLEDLAIDAALSALFKPASGAGASGVFGGLLHLFGFAKGGEFTVGGSGGTDSQLVTFLATPNEKVTITPPGRAGGNGGGGQPILIDQSTNNFNASISGVDRAQIAAMMDRKIAASEVRMRAFMQRQALRFAN
jgi:hypothetical protein